MIKLHVAAAVCLAASFHFAHAEGADKVAASTDSMTVTSAALPAWSSSAALPEAPGAMFAPAPAPAAAAMGYGQATRTVSTRPLSALAIAVKIGTPGIGFDVATPLSRRFNLRGTGSFFSYMHQFTEDGIVINPDLKFRQGAAFLDFYPFAGSFRISPGYVFYNGNHATASAGVPGGQSFTLDDTDYVSSLTDPVHGSAEVTFGKKEAPALTVGWGNMISRHGGHFSFPVELGVMFNTAPKLTYNLAGTACNQFGCRNVATDPEIQSNIISEQNDLNNDLYNLRFYPIATIGISYKF